MKVGQTGDLMYHGTGILSTMDPTGTLWVSPTNLQPGLVVISLGKYFFTQNSKGHLI